MCGIIGIYNSKNVKKQLKKGLKAMEHRGRDATNIEGNLGHNLHAIINHIKQPLKKKFVSNCEIYNWKELGEGKNDAEVMLDLIEKEGINSIEKFDGVFALAYEENSYVYLARDIIGVKPLWYSHKDSFAFASEKKVLEELGFLNVTELNPRKILKYDIKKNKIEFIERKFFPIKPKVKKDVEKLIKLVEKAIKKRLTDKKMGVLFSGGIDSTLIAFLLKKYGVDFTCYTAALDEKTMKKADDLVWAEKAAKEMGFKLKVKKVKLKDVEKYIKKVVPLIEDSNVVKVGVALPFYISCEEAKKDNVKVIFSGLGSEEIFAGYERHQQSRNINEECVYGLKQMYQRDLYRDDVVTMFHSIELRVPFLDKDLVKYALKIPSKYKIKNGVKKYILREAALKLGLKKEYAMRKKKAAQYGSKFDKAIKKLAKKKKKSEYLRKFYPRHNLKLGALFSSGKDSTYAVYIMKKMNYDISCLITLKSKNPHSWMFHTPNIDLVDLQSESLGIPLLKFETEGKKEDELKDLKKAVKKAKDKYNLDGIVTGALFSTYQRNRIETICDELGLKVFAPLWHKNQEEEMRELIEEGFEFILSNIAADGLDKSWLGKVITLKDVDRLVEINKKNGINIAFEGGEAETLMINGPMFKKKINIKKARIEMEDEFTGNFIIEDAA